MGWSVSGASVASHFMRRFDDGLKTFDIEAMAPGEDGTFASIAKAHAELPPRPDRDPLPGNRHTVSAKGRIVIRILHHRHAPDTCFIGSYRTMIYGYDSRVINEYGLKQMREISISARAETLRQLADFLIGAAHELETGAVSEHWHLHIDRELQRGLGCDLIVLTSKPDGSKRR